MTYKECLAQTLIPGSTVEPAYGIRGFDSLARGIWLEWRTSGVDRKDKAAMRLVANDYKNETGVNAALVEVWPEYGPNKGKFWGYNVVETW